MRSTAGAKPTEASRAAERLRSEIVAGRVRPGSRLKLEGLSERYAVGRGPLREAAARLVSEGLLTFEDQRGFRVAPVSRADLIDLTETRKRVEALALQEAIGAGDIAWEGTLLSAAHVLRRTRPDDPEFSRRHRAFHAALVAACPLRYLLSFRARLYDLGERYRRLAAAGYAGGLDKRDIDGEHDGLAEAAVGRRQEEAVARLRAHLDATKDSLLARADLFE